MKKRIREPFGACRRPRSSLLGSAALVLCAALAPWGISGESPASRPKIALVIDDFGLTYPKNVPDEEWMKLPFSMTFAVMPESPRTRQAAEATRKAGKELIVHFPFDPFLSLELSKAAPSDADREKVSGLLEKSLADIPGAVGLNNHRSYRATQNEPLMKWFMGEIKGKGLYFVDSRVSPRTVAFREARGAGIPSAINDVFLDEATRHDKAFCERMLRSAVSIARRRGKAIAIGHHYFHGTFQCLREQVPRLQTEGIEFVFASEIVE